MKRLYRLFAFVFVLMIGAGIAIGTTVSKVAYAATPNGLDAATEAIQIKHVPDQANFGEAITLGGAAGVTLEVKDPTGTVVEQYDLAVETEATAYETAVLNNANAVAKNADGTYTIKPYSVGYYTIQYFYTSNGVAFVTPEYKMLVSKTASYTGEFEYNSELVLPAQVGLNAKIVLPFPAAYDANGNVLVDYTGAAKQTGYGYKIIVKMDGKTLSSAGASTGVEALTKNADGYYEFTALEGVATVNYILTKDGAEVADIATKTISCDANYDVEAVNLSMTVTGLPTTSSASVGSKTYLPLPSVTDKGNVGATINFYTIIKVKTGDTNVTVSKDDKGLYFVPTVVGDYTISYNVKDFYGNTLSEDYTATVKNIHDTKSPTIYVVDTYIADRADAMSYDADFIASLTSATYNIPYKVNRDTVIRFPALYAVDEFVAYSDLTLTRRVTISGTTIDLNNWKYHVYHTNAGLIEGTYDKLTGTNLTTWQTEHELEADDDDYYVIKDEYRNMYAVNFTFADGEYKEGEYTVTYRASDNTTASTTFTRTLTLGSYTTNIDNVKISFESFPTVAREGEEITIVPVVSDYYDNDLKVEYTVAGNAVAANEDKSLTFTATSSLVTAGKITITVTATNDFDKTATVTKTISFIDQTEDNDAPTYVWGATTVEDTNTYEQYSIVRVRGVEFTDADNYMRTYFEVREITDDGFKVVTGAKLNGETLADGIYFKGNKAASYLVTYIAEDSSNNITVVGLKTKEALDDKQAPVINRESREYTMELGEELDLGEITATDNSGLDATITVTSDSDGYLVADTLFVPRSIGSYTITINAEDTAGNKADPVKLTVVVQDTTKPVIVVNNGDVYDSSLRIMPDTNNKFSEVELPAFSAYDVQKISSSFSELGIASAKITVAGPNSTTYTLDSSSETYRLTKKANGKYAFTPATKGTYTITYSATDLNGNEAESVVITLTAGDTVPPVIAVATDIKSTAKPGYSFTIKKSDITVTDAVDGTLSYSNIKLLNASGAEVEQVANEANNEFTYTLSDAGTYTLQVTATDRAGNTQTYSKSITVSESTASSVNKTEVVGIVLIVVAVVVIAVVIIFFVRTRNKKAKNQ